MKLIDRMKATDKGGTKMALYRKKPVVIEAVQWTGVNVDDDDDDVKILMGKVMLSQSILSEILDIQEVE